MRTVLLVVLFILTAPISIPIGIIYLLFFKAPRTVGVGVKSAVRQYQGDQAMLTREEWEAEKKRERMTVAEWKASDAKMNQQSKGAMTPAERYWATHADRDE